MEQDKITNQNKNQREIEKQLPKTPQPEEFDIDKWLFEVDLWTIKKVVPLKNKIVKEYNCQSSLELLLAGRIAVLYWRITHLEGLIASLVGDSNGVWEISYSLDDTRRKALKELSKSIESAHNQLITSTALLKEFKQPPLNLQIKTQGTFIAQNQQVNIGKTEKKNQKEKIIDVQ